MEMIYGSARGELDADGLAAAYPWPAGRPWLRAMMVTSLDGAFVAADGRTAALSSPGDLRVFAETRRLADVVLVGAATLRAERYGPIVASADTVGERESQGLARAPLLVVVSASLRLPWGDPVFAESEQRPLVVTVANCDGAALETARRHAEVVRLEGASVDAIDLVEQLSSRGLLRVVCEGGPRLLADLARGGVVDEADITIAPMMIGGGQIATGSAMYDAPRFTLVHSIVEDGYCFNRYTRPVESA